MTSFTFILTSFEDMARSRIFQDSDVQRLIPPQTIFRTAGANNSNQGILDLGGGQNVKVSEKNGIVTITADLSQVDRLRCEVKAIKLALLNVGISTEEFEED